MTEIEEGEAVLNDGQIFDFDKLSYLDEKVTYMLGHFRKDFEEGYEKLGAAWGGYGTFLPTKPRSPKAKSPQRLQTPSSGVRHPNLLRQEGIAASATTPRTAQRANAVPKAPSQRNENALVGGAKIPGLFDIFDVVANVPSSQRNVSATVPPQRNVSATVPSQRNASATIPSQKNSAAVGTAKAPNAVVNVQSSQKNGSATVGSAKDPVPDAVANVPSQRKVNATVDSTAAPALDAATQKNGSAAAPALDAATQNNGSAAAGSEKATAQAVEKTPKSHQQVKNKPVARDDKKRLNIRIKFGSEELPRRNTEIYSGLGLMSPSSSSEDSEGRKTPDLSLTSVLQMLTSVIDAGDLLKSPLDDSLQSLKERGASKRSSRIKVKRSLSSASFDDSASQSRHEDAPNSKHSQARVREVHKLAICSDEKSCEDDIQLRLKENSGAQMLARPSNSTAYASERNSGKISQEYDNGALSSKRTVTDSKTKDRILGNKSVKDESLKSISGQSSGKLGHLEPKGLLVLKKPAISQDMATDHGEGAKNNADKKPAAFRVDTDFSDAGKRPVKASSSEQKGVRMPDTATKSSSAGKNILKGASVKDKSSPFLAQGSRSGGSLVGSKENCMKRNAQETLEECFTDKAKESNFVTLKEKKGLGKLKEKPSNIKYGNQVESGAVVRDPPSGILPSNSATLGGEQATVDPVYIEENWVGCDKCGKWRLLPFGTTTDDLPAKWACRMQYWLPGMNRCHIPEEETTKAIEALNHPQNHAIEVPAVGQQSSFSFNSSSGGKKEASKGKETVVPVSRAKNSQQDMTIKRSSNDRKPYSDGSKPSEKLNGRRLSKPGIVLKSPLGGDAIAKKRLKKESEQDDRGIQKRIKGEGTFDIKNFKTSSPNHGRLANQKPRENDHSKKLTVGDKKRLLKSSREDETGSKKRKTEEWLNEPDLEGGANHIVSAKEESSGSGFVRDKKPRVSRSDGNGSCRSKSTTELKSRPIPAVPKNIVDGKSDLLKQPNKLRMIQNSGMTLEDLESLKKSLGCEPTSATSSSSKGSSSRKTRSCFQEWKGSPVDSVSSSPMRMSKRNDVSGFNNTKVADLSTSSRKVVTGGANHDAKPPAMATKRKSSDLPKEEHNDKVVTGAANDGAKPSVMSKKRKSPDLLKEEHNDKAVTGDTEPAVMAKKRKSSDLLEEHADRLFPETDAALVISNSAVKRESRNLLDVTREDHVQPEEKEVSNLKPGDSCNKDAYGPLKQGLINISTQEDRRKEKSNVDRRKVLPDGIKLAPATQNGSLPEQAHDVSLRDVVPMVSKDLGHALTQSEPCGMVGNFTPVRPLVRELGTQGRSRRDASSLTSQVVLKEAEDQRAFADQIKGSGFGHEYNETIFQASLKFLRGASLLEAEIEKNRSRGMNHLPIYISTAKNFETCAHEYERQKEMALAAMAYKCVEVAYLRVVYCKSSSSSRNCHVLHTSLQTVPLGESPSSSASDVDNLNNQAVAEKAPLSESSGALSDIHAIALRTRPNVVHLLDFTKEVNSAMEASRKALNAFAAAALTLEDPPNKEGMAAVKRVMDFGFHNIEDFLRLVRVGVASVESCHRPAIGLQ